ncbi:uncharacterized protein LOC144653446 isoform X1 [Oculina patagonica]
MPVLKDMTEEYGYTALHNAIITRDLKATHKLATSAAGCDIESRDSMGFTALHLATLQGNKDLVEMLIQAGCNTNSRTKEGMTSLHISGERTGANDILSLLTSVSCDVNARNKLGRTALHLAAKVGNLENLRTLLDAGCDRNIKDKLGFTAVGLAFKFNQKASADVLLHYKPRRKQTVCEVTDSCETLSKEVSCENSQVKSEGVEGKLIAVTPPTKCQEICDKSLLEITASVTTRKALSLKIYHLILSILTQKRNVMDGLLSSKSRKTLESVETAFKRKLLNLILTSTSFYRYTIPSSSYTISTLDDKLRKQSLCELKPVELERSNSLSKSFESNVLTKLMKSLKDTLRFASKSQTSVLGILVNKLPSDDGPWVADEIVKIFLQVCVALASDQRLLLFCTGAVMKRGLSHPHSNAMALGTCILVRMGLLKQEDKVDVVNDLTGPLLALEHLCTEEYFPRDLAAIFASFLCKASPKLFGLDQLRLRAVASAVTKEILPTTAQEAESDTGKRFKRICDMVAVEGDCELLIKCVDLLFSRVFVTLRCDLWAIGESILIYLGLLKSEFDIETVRSLSCALKVLHHAVKQSYFPSVLKQLVACFLQKPNPALTPYFTKVDEILGALSTSSQVQ